MKISDISLPVHERSVRNCPWSLNLWIMNIQASERYKKPFELVQSLFDRALQAGFSLEDEYRQLWLAYLESCARQVDWSKIEDNNQLSLLQTTFQRAIDYLTECKCIIIFLAIIYFMQKLSKVCVEPACQTLKLLIILYNIKILINTHLQILTFLGKSCLQNVFFCFRLSR